MAWPANIISLREHFDATNSHARNVRARALRVRNASASGPVNREDLLVLQRELDRAIDVWQSAQSVPGMVAYARNEFDDATLDVAAEFVTMRNAAIALRDWIFNNFPKDAGSGAFLVAEFDQEGNQLPLTFSTAQLAAFRTEADAFIATIAAG